LDLLERKKPARGGLFAYCFCGKVWLRGQDLLFSVPLRRLCLLAFQKVEASIQDAATGSGSFSSIHSEPGILLPVLYPGHSLSP
ncbi:hypothetical protein ACCT22_30055, partial [Rhizobium johnstonii]|uniref:hypothetical protein n=1 Tax=Rhizobium johnstonii TaxID=3019933 RepID=UPI003F9D5F24